MTMTTFSQDIKGDLWDGHNPQLRGEWLGPSLSAESLSDGRCLSLKCHNASVIRTSLARPSRSHTVNTSWALSQLWVWVTAERPFVFFFFLSFVLGWAAEGPTEMTAPREKQFPQAKSHKKIYIYARRWRLLQRLHLLISKMLKRSHWWILEFLSLWFLYRWSIIYASYGCKWACKQELLFVVGELSSISLVTTLSLVTAYICEH